jgi:glycosyltransferase involved in cell wall biosynthesis
VRILFLSPRQCWPARSGAKLREYHFARALAQRGPLTYLHFTDPGAAPLTREDLPFCQEVVAIPKPSAYGPTKLAQGLLGRWPLPILNYTSPEMSAAVDRLTATEEYDLIHLDSIHMIRYGEAAARRGGSVARVVYNWHNIESEAMQRFSATVSSPAKRWYARLTASKLAALEQGILKTAFGHVVCSEREREALQRLAPSARIAVIENGVDVAGFAAAADNSLPTRDTAAHKIVFVGLMDYFPNVEAATSFTQRIWPVFRQRFPNMNLWIVGANPAPAVLKLGDLEGVTVTGTVPEVRPYYRDALAAIVPLRTGGGTRLKILEAMAAGVPVVSTPLGAEGLTVTPGENILLADPDDVETWLQHLELLAGSEPARKGLSASALELVRTRYDWEILGRKLGDTYEGWLRGGI